MKNLRIVLVFSILTMISVTDSFAQDANEKKMLALEKREKANFSDQKHRELRALNDAYEKASTAEKLEIKEKIKTLKKEYDTKVKGVSNSALKSEEHKKEIKDNETFILESKARIKLAKERVAKAEANGEMTEKEAKAKKNKIAEIEEKLMQHELKVKEASQKQNKK